MDDFQPKVKGPVVLNTWSGDYVHMASLVEEIQRDALDRKVPVSDLLRKVKLAAAKLRLEKVEVWVDSELKGYTTEVPDYRKVNGIPMVTTLYHGTQPLQLPAGKEAWREIKLREPVAALEHNIAGDADTFIRPYPASVVASLREHNEGNVTQAGVRFSTAAMVKIIDTVRTLVLEWAIELEKAGVTGHEFSFSDDEKEKAARAGTTVINIGHIGTFTGNLGVGNQAGDIVASPASVSFDGVRSLVVQLASHGDALVSEGVDKSELDRLRSDLERELAKTAPDQTLISQLLREVSDKLKSAASGVVAQGIISLISQVLGLPAA